MIVIIYVCGGVRNTSAWEGVPDLCEVGQQRMFINFGDRAEEMVVVVYCKVGILLGVWGGGGVWVQSIIN